MNPLSDSVLFASHSSEYATDSFILLPFLILFVVFIVVVAAALPSTKMTTNVNAKNGLPYCPRCNRQVSYRRDNCRACGFVFRTPVTTNSFRPEPEKLVDIPIANWEKLHRSPRDIVAIRELRKTIEDKLRAGLLGAKTVDGDCNSGNIVVTRTCLQYVSHVGVFVTD